MFLLTTSEIIIARLHLLSIFLDVNAYLCLNCLCLLVLIFLKLRINMNEKKILVNMTFFLAICDYCLFHFCNSQYFLRLILDLIACFCLKFLTAIDLELKSLGIFRKNSE